MSLLVSSHEMNERSAVVKERLPNLLRTLAAELDATLEKGPSIPEEKAKLTRAGGRCPDDKTPLEFDPFSAERHRCPRCAKSFTGEEHYRWWIMSQQLFLAERAVHGALLFSLMGTERYAQLSESLLEGYAARYAGYPNSDNVLGPTRLFFSTYLESIWLLQICIALDLLEESGRATPALGTAVREKIIQPSSQIIASYDEGGSNRQAWNSAALLAAAVVLNDGQAFESAAERAGILMKTSILADGSWYEGENYHVFAHRGLWYIVEICARAGYSMPADVLSRYQRGFTIPFRTALPDMTMLARRDSQYGVSLRQWRFAELCELGLARERDGDVASQLLGALSGIYNSRLPSGDTGRSSSTAEVERNLPAVRLDRGDLGWKSLLRALPALPVAHEESASGASTLLDSQGIAVFRRERGRVMVALDYGHHGGGHGHPDRLNLNLAEGDGRWLDDPGTGSYVDPSLFWYRSTLAHNAPMAGWRTQGQEHGVLQSFSDDGSIGFAQATFNDSANDVVFSREVAVLEGYIIDELSWRCAVPTTVQLPLHIVPECVELLTEGSWKALSPDESARADKGMPDDVDAGLGFLTAQSVSAVAPQSLLRVRATVVGEQLRSYIWLAGGARVWRMRGPGPPGTDEREFIVLNATDGEAGSFTTVHIWDERVEQPSIEGDEVRIQLADGTRHTHVRGGSRWRIRVDGERSETREFRRFILPPSAEIGATPLDVSGRTSADFNAVEIPVAVERLELNVGEGAASLSFDLAEEHFRRSELTWTQHDEPTAVVNVAADRDSLLIIARVRKPSLHFAPRRDAPYLDNENPDVNSDGMQLHISTTEGGGDATAAAALLMVPEDDGHLRVSARTPGWQNALLESSWKSSGDGYVIAARLSRTAIAPDANSTFLLDVVINLLAPGRERRSGQLVLSGAAGEWIYLAGDRQPSTRLIPFRIANG